MIIYFTGLINSLFLQEREIKSKLRTRKKHVSLTGVASIISFMQLLYQISLFFNDVLIIHNLGKSYLQ